MTRIRLRPSGQEVDNRPGETVLQSLENAGYALANNCRAGACGECKTRVLSGEIDQGLVLDMALSAEERAQGYGLMCMAKPLSDILEIEFGTADAQPKLFPPRENVFCIVVDRIPRTPRVLELRLRPVSGPLRYWPGQYLQLGDERVGAPPRSYSIANAPRPDGELVLLVSREEGGATSRWIHDSLAVGDSVRIAGPYGTFIGDPSAQTPVLCMAAGSGLAPILALAEAALRRGYHQPVTLLFSARTEDDVFARGAMAYWEARHRNFRFIYTLTGEINAPLKGEGLRGRIPELLSQLFPDLSQHSVFVAGRPEFVEACTAAARTLGASESLLHTEGYFAQQTAESPAPERLLTAGGVG